MKPDASIGYAAMVEAIASNGCGNAESIRLDDTIRKSLR